MSGTRQLGGPKLAGGAPARRPGAPHLDFGSGRRAGAPPGNALFQSARAGFTSGALVCIWVLLATMGVLGDAPWALYINNQKFEAVTSGTVDTMQVDVKAFAHAAGIPFDKSDSGEVVLNGHPVGGVTQVAGTDYVPLRTVVDSAGMTLEVHADLQMIDVRPKVVVRTREEIEKEMVHAHSVTTYPQMEYLYRLVRDALDKMGLKITHPVETHWVTLAEIHKMAGADGYGYSTCKVRGRELRSLDLYVPFGLSPTSTLHSLAHELGHCWQYDNGVLTAAPLKMEGFAEWVASKVLQNLTLTGELQVMKLNMYAQYRDGLIYFENLERTQGYNAVLSDMLKSPQK